ncbi:MAG TPA: Maf family nucleotide pyrophosphatase [Bacteroidia bacterium]
MSKAFYPNKILLASQSPRRQMLLSESGFDMEVVKLNVEEDFPEALKGGEIPLYLAEKKNKAYTLPIQSNELLVTADTVVWLEDRVLNKPLDIAEAKFMLQSLSGKTHTVYTAVCIRSADKVHSFYDSTDVEFNVLTDEMIDYYLETHQPLDKAGAYGIQEFIGYVGIKKIIGCYYNVMGFPVSKFLEELNQL